MSEWETFCDRSYYDLWRVRRKNERRFDDGYHIHNGEEARELVELLNGLERERDEFQQIAIDAERELQRMEQLVTVKRSNNRSLDARNKRLERERDEWKAKYIQQNKDLGCEMIDPNGTIWDHAKKLQDENKALQEQLNAALMLGKMQERRHERELEQVREQYRLSSVCRKLIIENQKLKGEQP